MSYGPMPFGPAASAYTAYASVIDLSTQALRMAYLRTLWVAARMVARSLYTPTPNTGIVRYVDLTSPTPGDGLSHTTPFNAVPGGSKTGWTLLFKGFSVQNYDISINDVGVLLGSYHPTTGARVQREDEVAEIRPTAGGPANQAAILHQPTVSGTFTVSGLKVSNPLNVGTGRRSAFYAFGIKAGGTVNLEDFYVGAFPNDTGSPGNAKTIGFHGLGGYNVNLDFVSSRSILQGADQFHFERRGQGGTVNIRWPDLLNPLYEQVVEAVVQNNPLRIQVADTSKFATGQRCAIDQLNGTAVIASRSEGLGGITVISSNVVEFTGIDGTAQAGNVVGRYLTRDAGPDTIQVFRGPNIAATVTAVTPGASTQVTLSSVADLVVGQGVTFAGMTGTIAAAMNGQPAAAISNIAGNVITVPINTAGLAYTSGGTMTRDVDVGTINVIGPWLESMQNAKAALLVANNTIPPAGREQVNVTGGFIFGPDPSVTVQLESNFSIPINSDGFGNKYLGVYVDGFSGGFNPNSNGRIAGCVRVLQRQAGFASQSAFIDVGKAGATSNWVIENNTMIAMGNVSSTLGIDIGSSSTGTVRNNLLKGLASGISDPAAGVPSTNNIFFNVTTPYSAGSLHGTDRTGTDPLIDNIGRPSPSSIVRTGAAAIGSTFTDALGTPVASLSAPWVGAMQTAQP